MALHVKNPALAVCTVYDLHEKAGGSPLNVITAPNIHPSSKRGREVCKTDKGSQASRIKNVGPNGTSRTKQGGGDVIRRYLRLRRAAP